MPSNVTEVLARFAATVTYDTIPDRVREYCKDLLLDTLACALAGHLGEETPQMAALAAGLAQSKESSIIGGDRLSLAGATLLNGYLVVGTLWDLLAQANYFGPKWSLVSGQLSGLHNAIADYLPLSLMQNTSPFILLVPGVLLILLMLLR